MDFTRFRRQISTSSSKLLECKRAHLVKMTVPKDSMVETINLIERIRFGVLPGGVGVAFDFLFLQAFEEQLDNRIAPTAPLAANARD